MRNLAPRGGALLACLVLGAGLSAALAADPTVTPLPSPVELPGPQRGSHDEGKHQGGHMPTTGGNGADTASAPGTNAPEPALTLAQLEQIALTRNPRANAS